MASKNRRETAYALQIGDIMNILQKQKLTELIEDLVIAEKSLSSEEMRWDVSCASIKYNEIDIADCRKLLNDFIQEL